MDTILRYKLRKLAGGFNPSRLLNTTLNAVKPAMKAVGPMERSLATKIKPPLPSAMPHAPMAAPAPPVAAMAPPSAAVGQPLPAPKAPGSWKPAAIGAAGIGAGALALGPTGLGSELAWKAGWNKDPSRDLGFYTQRADQAKNEFKQREIDPLLKQYDSAVAKGDYVNIPKISSQLDKLHARYTSNDFGSAQSDVARAQEAYKTLQSGGGTQHGFFRPLIGGFSTKEQANQYDLNNLKQHNMPVPAHLGATDPSLVALQYPAQYRANWDANRWDPHQVAAHYNTGMPGTQEAPGSQAQYSRLFRSAGLTQ